MSGFSPARIEAAARAMWPSMDEAIDGEFACHRALEVLTAAFPELASGEAWVAPRVLSQEQAYILDTLSWAELRDAYLKEHP